MHFYIIQTGGSKILAAVAVACFAAVALAPVVRAVARSWMAHGNRLGRALFLLAAVGATLYGGAKHSGTITYPFTDVEARYLYDNGSYVTNDYVHVAFTRTIAPRSAPVYIDCRELGKTNDTDWVSAYESTIAAFDEPVDVPWPNATNYDWVVYTTWTPGPTVQTNGVWHSYWGLDRRARFYIIPVRTCVRDGGAVIATPKSREDATNETTEVILDE